MKTLLLLRHAKSSWAKPRQPDVERPLNRRGRQAARAMGKYIDSQGLTPELILCSPARRTQETLSRLRLVLPTESRIEFAGDLYLAEAARIAARIASVDAGIDRLMVIGHNPGFGELVHRLAAGNERADASRLDDGFVTGALAVFTADWPDWTGVLDGAMTLDSIVFPRDLTDAAETDRDG